MSETLDGRQRVVEALAGIPGFERKRAGDFALERQGGLTNLVYKLDFGGGRCFILRIPGKGTEAYIDREVEMHNARAAAAAGVSAEVIHGDAARDRKSVVAGKSVSGRVDRGGRRIIKK